MHAPKPVFWWSLVVSVLVIACGEPPSATHRSALGSPSSPSLISQLSATPTLTVSTVPPSGDVNPYGVAFVPPGFPSGGAIAAGDIVVANFNNAANAQGTGSTIVAVHPDGTQTLFFQGPPGLGLSTAIGVLRGGFVIVGNVPSTNGSGACRQTGAHEGDVGGGALRVLDKHGSVVHTLVSEHLLDGPWDLTVLDHGHTAAVFVSDALSGAVVRFDLDVEASVEVAGATIIASGYTIRCDPAAFVVGPTGVALDEASDTLYVASTADNAIYSIAGATTRTRASGRGALLVSDAAHLHGPLGLALAPNGDLVSAQGDAVNPDPNQPSELVEFDASGAFVAERSVDAAPGSAFGLAVEAMGEGFTFAAVDDATNVLDVWDVP